jgi:hypothetical protein
MAPRAGFEVQRKFLSALVLRASDEPRTPSDTPHLAVLKFVALTRSRAWFRGMVSRTRSLGNLSAFSRLCALRRAQVICHVLGY